MGRHVALQEISGQGQVVICSGDWTSLTAQSVEAELAAFRVNDAAPAQLRVDIDGIEKLDTVGAFLLNNFRSRAGDRSGELVGGSEQHRLLLERIEESSKAETVPAPRHVNFLLAPFVKLGQIVVGAGQDIIAANAVQGRLLDAFFRTITFRAPIRFASVVNQFEQIVLRAIPIVALISLVVGAIITQQTILQLRVFGAVIFVVDLAAILMFREIGVLLAAIMVAGRSGSAITAEIGAMRIREEFDALRVMGVDPYQALVMPRIIALVLGLPLLTFVGSIAGLCGAALVARFYGDISLEVFLDRLQGAMSVRSVVVGMVKAPFMAFLVGLLATIEGMKVSGSSESLGQRTTSSVVKSIFVVIVADGLFAVFFAAIGF